MKHKTDFFKGESIPLTFLDFPLLLESKHLCEIDKEYILAKGGHWKPVYMLDTLME